LHGVTPNHGNRNGFPNGKARLKLRAIPIIWRWGSLVKILLKKGRENRPFPDHLLPAGVLRLLLVGVVVTDNAARSRPDQAVARPDIMAGDTPDDCSLDAALCIGGWSRGR
jgi:hypothetical protein